MVLPEMTDHTREMTCEPAAPPVAYARPVGHPLGPLVVWCRLESPVVGRLYALVFAGILLAVLAVAAWLNPSHGHLGTHEQFGLPPCSFVAMTGYPCPTCGMTTAYACVVRGWLIDAVRASLFGSLLAIGTILAVAACLISAVVGRYPNLNWYRVNAVNVVYLGALLLVASWGLKILIGLCDGTLPVR